MARKNLDSTLDVHSTYGQRRIFKGLLLYVSSNFMKQYCAKFSKQPLDYEDTVHGKTF